jgi:BlaI family penicillinase repressor
MSPTIAPPEANTKFSLFLRKYHYFYEVFIIFMKTSYMHISQQEEMALQAIWKTGEGNIKMILENFPKPKPPYTTLASSIKNLERKRLVKSRPLGNMRMISAVITEEEYYEQFISKIVKRKFANSYKALVNFFVEKNKLSSKELKEIIELVDKSKEK